jgi:uncharacterized protein YegL
MSEQTPYLPVTVFETVEFAENPEPRCPCILLLDCSSSMQGAPIKELNNGLKIFKDQLISDNLAAKRVEVTVIKFSSDIELINEFEVAEEFEPQELTAEGLTSMGKAIEEAIQLLSARKEIYKRNGISYYRPWIFMITDGCPTDNWERAAEKVKRGESNKEFAFFAVGINNADMNRLSQIAVRKPLKLKGLDFRELFQWLSNSMHSVSSSTPEDKIKLEVPGWSEI